jgi:hypothetical protein
VGRDGGVTSRSRRWRLAVVRGTPCSASPARRGPRRAPPADEEERDVAAEARGERTRSAPQASAAPRLERARRSPPRRRCCPRRGRRRPEPLVEAAPRAGGARRTPGARARRHGAVDRADELCRGGPDRTRSWRVSSPAGATARLRRSAGRAAPSPSGGAWKPSGRRPTTASVRLSLAGRAGRRA